MAGEPLGELEQLVLLTILRLGSSAYGVPIVDELRRHTRRPILRPSVYLALRRLEDKGLIRSHLGEPEARRGGRARRTFEVTAAGKKQLRESRRTLASLWRGITLDEVLMTQVPAPDLEPPRLAVALLSRRLSATERDDILGDLEELFADRVVAGRWCPRLWFWMQAAGFVFGFAAAARMQRTQILFSRRSFMERLSTTFARAVRRLRFEWRYAAGVTLVLAVGLGPAAAMSSIVQKVLLRPLDYLHADRLGMIRIDLGQLQGNPGLAMAEIADLRKMPEVFAGVEGIARRGEISLGPPEHLEPLSSIAITPGLLPLLGVSPVVGRQLTDADANSTTAPTVLIDYGLWQSHFGGAVDITSRTMLINGQTTQIAGVLPRGFVVVTGRAVPQPIDVYLPLRLRDNRTFWAFTTLVRLRDGVGFDRAAAALGPLAPALKSQYPDAYGGALRFTVSPLLDDVVKDARPALRAAMTAVLLLLLIAVANATALVIARLGSRERDLAIRSAIGAGRSALVADVLAESVVLSLCGAALGSAVAIGALAAAKRLVPHSVPRWSEIGVSWDVILYCALFSIAGLIASGLIPVWKVSRRSHWHVLRSGSSQGGGGAAVLPRLLLVGAQMALTVVLAFASLQLMRSAARLSDVHLGFDPNVLAFRAPLDATRFRPPADIAVYERLRDRLRDVPGVQAVGASSHLPLSGAFLTDAYTADTTKTPGWDEALANYYSVLPGYFASLQIPVLQGRDFTDVEDRDALHVIVVDDLLARTAFPGVTDVIGKTLKLGWGIPDSQIVGVVGHVRGVEIAREFRPQIYAPLGTFRAAPMNFTVRSTSDPLRLTDAVQAAVHEVGTGRAISSFSLLQDNVSAATSTLRSVTGLVITLAVSAGLLSAIGLYTVIAFVMHQRRRATAIRSALGASRGQLLRHHLRTTGVVMVVALPVGVGLALAVAPLFGSLLYEVGNRDALSLIAALAIALAAGALGTYIPVRRAANTDPVLVLRGE